MFKCLFAPLGLIIKLFALLFWILLPFAFITSVIGGPVLLGVGILTLIVLLIWGAEDFIASKIDTQGKNASQGEEDLPNWPVAVFIILILITAPAAKILSMSNIISKGAAGLIILVLGLVGAILLPALGHAHRVGLINIGDVDF